MVTWIALAINYLDTGSREFVGLDLSDLLGLRQIDDLDGVWPNEARAGLHHGADRAVPADRSVPGPLVLRSGFLSVCSGALSLGVH